jgi:hypothetical protein
MTAATNQTCRKENEGKDGGNEKISYKIKGKNNL